jgi:hypothetical protein
VRVIIIPQKSIAEMAGCPTTLPASGFRLEVLVRYSRMVGQPEAIQKRACGKSESGFQETEASVNRRTTLRFRQWRSWLRGVDLNHRPLGYEPKTISNFQQLTRRGWPSKNLVRSVREWLWDSERTGEVFDACNLKRHTKSASRINLIGREPVMRMSTSLLALCYLVRTGSDVSDADKSPKEINRVEVSAYVTAPTHNQRQKARRANRTRSNNSDLRICPPSVRLTSQ